MKTNLSQDLNAIANLGLFVVTSIFRIFKKFQIFVTKHGGDYVSWFPLFSNFARLLMLKCNLIDLNRELFGIRIKIARMECE